MKHPIFVVVGAFITLLLCFGTDAAARSEGKREVHKTYHLAKEGEVFIDTFKGTITIETWDKQEVKIDAEIVADGQGNDDAEKVGETEIRIIDSPDRIRVKSDYDGVKSHFSFFGFFDDNSGSLPLVNYTITMPASARLRIKDYKSDSHIANLHSSLDVETYKGTVAVKGFDGSIDLETYKGDVSLDIARLGGSSRVETQKGKIEIGLPAATAFDLDTDLGRRANFDSDFDVSVNGKRRDENSYRAAINGGGPLLRIISEKGNVRLRKI